MATRGERNLNLIPSVAEDATADDDLSQSQLAIAIPGIRTDGTWVDGASTRVKRWARPIKIVKAGPNRISTYHLVTRLGVSKLRREIQDDITNTVIEYQSTHSISVVCHSMGASLFAEILDELNFKFDKIIFVGSVCHRDHALKIRKHCNIFVNHCGAQDVWPVLAEIINPFNYSATGTIGFRRPFSNDTFFNNNHSTCTQRQHMDKYVIPLLYDTTIEPPIRVNYRFSSTLIKYTRILIFALAIGAGIVYFKPLFLEFCHHYSAVNGRLNPLDETATPS